MGTSKTSLIKWGAGSLLLFALAWLLKFALHPVQPSVSEIESASQLVELIRNREAKEVECGWVMECDEIVILVEDTAQQRLYRLKLISGGVERPPEELDGR